MRLLDRHILSELTPIFLAAVIGFAGFIWVAAGPLLLAIKYLSEGFPRRAGLADRRAGLCRRSWCSLFPWRH